MPSNLSSRNREPLEPQRDVGHLRVAGLLQAAGLFDNYEYSDQFGWDL